MFPPYNLITDLQICVICYSVALVVSGYPVCYPYAQTLLIPSDLMLVLSYQHMSHIMRKPNYRLCKNKGEDQLCSYCTADLHLCFCLMDTSSSQASILLLQLHRPVCFTPGRNPESGFLPSCSNNHNDNGHIG